MKYRGRDDHEFDGLTADEVRRIRGAAAANVTPGLEAFVEGGPVRKPQQVTMRAGDTVVVPDKGARKRGRRT